MKYRKGIVDYPKLLIRDKCSYCGRKFKSGDIVEELDHIPYHDGHLIRALNKAKNDFFFSKI
jgi:5-methylcytosine-specific restriction endonuclease McrA